MMFHMRSPRFAALCVLVGLLGFGWTCIGREQLSPSPELVFRVWFEPTLRSEPASGRVVVYLIREGGLIGPQVNPAEGPFFLSPQPMFGVNVTDLRPGQFVTLDDSATSFPVEMSRLPRGKYRAQAVLDMHRDDSDWQREPGNLFSRPLTFTIAEGRPLPRVDLKLEAVTQPRPPRETAGMAFVEVPSRLLSEFRGKEVKLRVGVIYPVNWDKSRQYAAIYEVPGFGGDDRAILHELRKRTGPEREDPRSEIWKHAFKIILNPEGPNGHHLFTNSANNGPVADALIQEVIPALEQKFNLVPRAEARLLRGHSSGGWSVIWLAMNYPDVFGAAWSSSPDPVDFRRFQLSDIYAQESIYSGAPASLLGNTATELDGQTVSYRDQGVARMTVRDENLMEEVIGPSNTSGQQWDSWFAVFGPRGADGNPAALFDPATGKIDRAVAEQYRKYDISWLLRSEPEKYGPIFKQRIRIVVGTEDDFFLNEAVELLRREIDALSFFDLPEGSLGYITFAPGCTHGTVVRNDIVLNFNSEMLEHLRKHNLLSY